MGCFDEFAHFRDTPKAYHSTVKNSSPTPKTLIRPPTDFPEAINGTYIDKKCPFTGDVSIRGRILTGVVHSTKMTNTIIIRREYLHFIPKYRRYEKRHKNLAVHCSPAFRVEQGDLVTVGA